MEKAINLEKEAIALAEYAHRGQKYGDLPYTSHLVVVVATLRLFGFTDSCTLAAGWLHDVVEDTSVTLEQVRNGFGDEIAELVNAVTSEKGCNRKERNAKTYPKILNCDRAIYLKLADRIANVKASKNGNLKKFKMYLDEQPSFRLALYQQGKAEEMWTTLEELFTSDRL